MRLKLKDNDPLGSPLGTQDTFLRPPHSSRVYHIFMVYTRQLLQSKDAAGSLRGNWSTSKYVFVFLLPDALIDIIIYIL